MIEKDLDEKKCNGQMKIYEEETVDKRIWRANNSISNIYIIINKKLNKLTPFGLHL